MRVSTDIRTPPLALESDAMRAMGHQAVELLVELLSNSARPALRRASAAEMAARLPRGAPAGPADFDDVLERLRRDVLPYAGRSDHPGYMAFIPTCGTFPSALGDFIASALNLYAGSWMEGAGPSQVELVVLDWFKSWIGYPTDAAGLLMSGGSLANITALACAREALIGAMDGRAVVYVGDQAHSSIVRAARLLGFGADQLRVLPADGDQRLQPETVAAAIRADLSAGRLPLLLAAAAGATNTGAIDPLRDLAAVCRDHGVWLHVDAAYGGFAALTERGRRALAGLELADSVTLDPHKWLYQPVGCGCVLVRDGRLLERAFSVTAPYLADVTRDDGGVNFADLGLEQSRPFRALRVWLSVSLFGLDAFRDTVDAALDLARLARRRIAEIPELESVADGELGITCFRRRTAGGERQAARVNAALIAAWEATGCGLVSSTRVGDRFAVRLCALNHTTSVADVDRVLRFFATS